MNPNEAVASEVAAPAASKAAAPGAGQEYVGVGPAAPGGLPVAIPAGSSAAGVQLGTLPRSKTLLSSKIPSGPVVAASRPGSPVVAGSRTQNPVNPVVAAAERSERGADNTHTVLTYMV